MAGSFSDFLELELLDHIFTDGAYTPPATLYVGLYTAAPTDAGGGTEVTGGSYARKSTTAADWDAAAAGSKSNGASIDFVTATANWGTVVAFGIFDAASAGNLLIWADLNTSKSVDNGDTAKFPAGNLTINLD